MGVKLTDLVVRKELSIEQLRGKILAVDFSNALYQFLASIRQRDGTPLMDSKGRVTSHLMGIFTRFTNILGAGIKLVAVFDGERPMLKQKTIETRGVVKAEARRRYEQAVSEEDVEGMFRYSKMMCSVNQGMLDESKELILALGIPVIQAPFEADAQCSYMTKTGDVWAVATQDFDPLLFGAKRVVQNLAISQRRRLPSGGYIETKPFLIEFEQTLSNINLNQKQLIALAILIGTDYNPKGIHGIGPKKALQLVRGKKFEEFDSLFKGADFNWREIFNLFENMEVNKDYELKFKEADKSKIKKILVKEHDFNEERVNSVLNKLEENKGLVKWF